MDNLTPDNVFRSLVEKHGAKCLFRDLCELFPRYVRTDQWFRDHGDKFICFEDDRNRIAMVAARLPPLKICGDYVTSGCKDDSCKRLHMCKHHVGGCCPESFECEKDHHFQSAHNRHLLRALDLKTYSEQNIMNIVANSNAHVCFEYNRTSGECGNGDRCVRLHVCTSYIEARAQGKEAPSCGADCTLAHTFESKHSQRILHSYGFTGQSAEAIVQCVIFPIARTRRQPGPTVEVPRHTKQRQSDKRKAGNRGPKNERWRSQPAVVLGNRSTDTTGTEESKEPPPASEDPQTPLAQGASDEPMVETQAAAVPLEKETKAETDLGAKPEPAATPPEPTPVTSLATTTQTSDVPYVCLSDEPHSLGPGTPCPHVHFFLPYIWQVKIEERWYNLGSSSCDLEETFCKPEQIDYATQVPRDAPGDWPDTPLIVDFNAQPMKAEAYRGSCRATSAPIRRLCTPPGGDTATTWMWYKEGGRGNWHPFDQDLCPALEQHFADEKKLLKLEEEDADREEHEVDLVEMEYRNLSTGKTKRLRRRPQPIH